jgi:YesN/AraC family two-component response regulator
MMKILDGVKKHYNYVEFVREYIEMNYKENILLEDLATVLNISRTYLSYLFKKEVGVTFPQYLNKFRIRKAMDLLKYTDLQIKEISKNIGYRDPSYFNKLFRETTKKAPQEYRITQPKDKQ